MRGAWAALLVACSAPPQPPPVVEPPVPSVPGFKVACHPSDPAPSARVVRRLTGREISYALQDVLPWVRADYAPNLTWLGDKPAVAGFENDPASSAVNRPAVEDAADVATNVGRLVSERSAGIPSCYGDAACIRSYVLEVARLLWRRDLSAEERTQLTGLFDEVVAQGDVPAAAGAAVEAILASPDFLYRLEGAQVAPPGAGALAVTPVELASRLSFLLWDSVPDDELLDAASGGRLGTPAEIEAQARRMVADPRFVRMLGAFHVQWLSARERTSVSGHPPDGTVMLNDSLDAELEHFLGAALENGLTLRELLTTSNFAVNGDLALMYGLPHGADGWRVERLDPAKRKGILTTVSFLGARTDNFDSSPIKRGHTMQRSIFCVDVPPAPNTALVVVPKPAEYPDATNRERYDRAVKVNGCWGCHQSMNELGYGLESYDILGMWRDTDHGKPVDASGRIVSSDVDGPFNGGVELVERVAGSAQVRECYASHWMRYALGRAETGCETLPVAERFEESGGDIVELIVAVATSDALRTRTAAEAAP